METGAFGDDYVRSVAAGEGFGHLAADAVPDADEQDFPVTLGGVVHRSGAVVNEFQEIFVDSRIIGQFRVKRGGQDFAFADEDGMAGIFGEDFDGFADRFDDWGTDENHFERSFAQLGGGGVDV